MQSTVRWLVLPALAFAWLGLATGAHAQRKKAAPPAPYIPVTDRAEWFSKDKVRTADEKIKEIKERYNKTLAIETYKTAPEGKGSEPAAINAWAEDRYNALGRRDHRLVAAYNARLDAAASLYHFSQHRSVARKDRIPLLLEQLKEILISNHSIFDRLLQRGSQFFDCSLIDAVLQPFRNCELREGRNRPASAVRDAPFHDSL